MMHFVRDFTPEQVAARLADDLTGALQAGKHVLWLVSGGSAIGVAVQTSQIITTSQVDTSKLAIMQVDERYGDVGHKDSNWQQLLDAGFRASQFTCYPVLTGVDLQTTVVQLQKQLTDDLAQADMRIGLFGMGADGHTAGMLPHSSAASEQHQFVAQFKGTDYDRITITAPVIAQLDIAIVYANGEAKLEALQNLQTDMPIADQPAQALKLAHETWVYNDQVGETS